MDQQHGITWNFIRNAEHHAHPRPTVSEYELEQLCSGRWERERGASRHCPPCSFIGPGPTCGPRGGSFSTQGEYEFLSNNKNTKSTDYFLKMELTFSIVNLPATWAHLKLDCRGMLMRELQAGVLICCSLTMILVILHNLSVSV